MTTRLKIILTAAVSTVACCRLAWAQAPATILTIDTQNNTYFDEDVFDVKKYATDPNKTIPLTGTGTAPTFTNVTSIGDIVQVNGKPAKGTCISKFQVLNLTTTPRAGAILADINRFNIGSTLCEILQADGTAVGTIAWIGLGNGTPPPGSPALAGGANFVVTGGSGAFLGVHGQGAATKESAVFGRPASVTEDPSNRRVYGGGTSHTVFTLIPMFRPAIVMLPEGPAVVHATDYSLVTAANPARAGEVLSLYVTGLGPIRAEVDPGQPFPANPPGVVNSPVTVTVNGAEAEVLYAGGYPGSVDGYQVNLRLPVNLTPGLGTIQVAAAWIQSPAVQIAVR